MGWLPRSTLFLLTYSMVRERVLAPPTAAHQQQCRESETTPYALAILSQAA